MSSDYTIDDLKSWHKMIHYFGLGFIQIKLDELCRIHVYHEKLPMIVPEESIHNHRYDFISIVRSGAIQQDIYQVEIQPPGSWRVADGIMHSVTCKEGEEAPDDTERVYVNKLVSMDLMDSSYRIDKDTFHRVKLSPNCKSAITAVYRDPTCKWKKFAQVVTLDGAEEVCPFSHKMPEAELWDIVEDAFKND